MAKQKNVYFFGQGKAEGDAKMKDILGGKGANLAEMTNMGIPVPPGFTISTEVCAAYYENGKKYPAGLEDEVLAILLKLEKVMGKKLGDPGDPLLVSVRSGAAVSMPGMMDTILNLGLSDRAVEGLAAKTGNPRFAWDAYRRFIQMYGDVVMGVPAEYFEDAIKNIKNEKNIFYDMDLSAHHLEELVVIYKRIVRECTGAEFPQDPLKQFWGAVNAVFGSWMNERAIKYRQLYDIRNARGTAVNIQSMVFGNFGEDSGTGVCFSRDPSTGVKEFYGEYLMNAQGEDVVAGIRTPEKISALEQTNKEVYDQLVNIKDTLEDHFRDMQDMEFTIQQGRLYLLQTRNAKRTGPAAVKCAVDMVAEGLIDKKTAVLRVSPDLLDQLLHPMIETGALKEARAITKGLNASPGAATGRIVFNARDAEEWNRGGEKVLLVRQDTSPEDIGGMVASQGVLTSTGGMTSHAAVVARGMGTPCVAGAKGVTVQDRQLIVGSKIFYEGDWITIDGSTGEVYEGRLPLVHPDISKIEEVTTFLGWCDEFRSKAVRGKLKGFEVRTNADQPEDAKRAFDFGADGVGLCRTEHMFFDKDKLIHFRAMIVAASVEERKAALQKILPLQKNDFFGIFKAMEGRPVTIRLLDPPLHEFVPHTWEETQELAHYLQVNPEELKPKLESLREANPMLGHRGCRLAVTYPEIYDMQVEAIALAAVECIQNDIPVQPEIMIPIVITARELKFLRPNAEAILKRVFDEAGVNIHVKIGTMIEVPRAAIRSEHIARYADFFSFGTNDLTQMTFAFSRDDVASFLPAYLDKKILDVDPFKSIDEEGVGTLIRWAVENGRGVNPELKVGICGEHGGDPATIDFCYRAGLNYVSCSPFRIPLARLAGAQAVIKNTESAAPRGRGRPKKIQEEKPAAKPKAAAKLDTKAKPSSKKEIKPTVITRAKAVSKGKADVKEKTALKTVLKTAATAKPVGKAAPKTKAAVTKKTSAGKEKSAKSAAVVSSEAKKSRGRPSSKKNNPWT
ncbi:MAG: pyruvate, phosphate dikinase [Treponema sp.]|jgi:pyruvate,orthophosphate dikinase|nr:pyruvate, phosphate dikinase [Treponema sp.]